MRDHERATQVWAVLVLAAKNRQILTYEILFKLIGVPERAQANILNHVRYYCEQKHLPSLTSIVVSKKTGLPAEGFIAIEAKDIPGEQNRVFSHDWFTSRAPSSTELETAFREIRER